MRSLLLNPTDINISPYTYLLRPNFIVIFKSDFNEIDIRIYLNHTYFGNTTHVLDISLDNFVVIENDLEKFGINMPVARK